MAFCPNCGKELKNGEKFCPNCGKAVGISAPEGNQQPTPGINVTPQSTYTADDTGKKKKGNKGLIVAVVIIAIILLASLGSRVRKNGSRNAGTKDVANKVTSSNYEDVVGNYVGLHGSGLTLYPDGTADYYWKGYDHVDDGAKYTYENGRVTVTTNVIDYPFYADKKNGESTLNFQADASSWLDEDFVKVSDEAKGLSIDEWNDTIGKKLNISIADNKEQTAKKDTFGAASDSSKESAKKEEKKEQEKSKGEKTEEKVESSDGVDPDLKAYLDSYEDFMDDYVDFMKKYQSGTGDTMSMLTEYTEMLGKYQDFATKIESYDTSKMSNADYKYYMEITTRVLNKMSSLY